MSWKNARHSLGRGSPAPKCPPAPSHRTRRWLQHSDNAQQHSIRRARLDGGRKLFSDPPSPPPLLSSPRSIHSWNTLVGIHCSSLCQSRGWEHIPLEDLTLVTSANHLLHSQYRVCSPPLWSAVALPLTPESRGLEESLWIQEVVLEEDRVLLTDSFFYYCLILKM